MQKLIPIELLNGDFPPVQDFIILNGRRSPGVCTVTGAGSPRKWDKPTSFGYSGASLTYTGDDVSEFDVIVQIWEHFHWAQWNAFARELEKRSTGLGAKCLHIVHPVLYRAPLRISQVVVRDVSGFDQVKPGLWACRIEFTEWRDPVPALGKPNGAIPPVGRAIDPFELDPELKGLVDKARALGGAV